MESGRSAGPAAARPRPGYRGHSVPWLLHAPHLSKVRISSLHTLHFPCLSWHFPCLSLSAGRGAPPESGHFLQFVQSPCAEREADSANDQAGGRWARLDPPGTMARRGLAPAQERFAPRCVRKKRPADVSRAVRSPLFRRQRPAQAGQAAGTSREVRVAPRTPRVLPGPFIADRRGSRDPAVSAGAGLRHPRRCQAGLARRRGGPRQDDSGRVADCRVAPSRSGVSSPDPDAVQSSTPMGRRTAASLQAPRVAGRGPDLRASRDSGRTRRHALGSSRRLDRVAGLRQAAACVRQLAAAAVGSPGDRRGARRLRRLRPSRGGRRSLAPVPAPPASDRHAAQRR